MNMGTLTGAPKVSAMQLLAPLENNTRGFFGGGIGYFESADGVLFLGVYDDEGGVRGGGGGVGDAAQLTEGRRSHFMVRSIRWP